MEELRIYLDLVDELGDPFTLFERIEWSDESDEPEVPLFESPSGRHAVAR